MSDWFLDGKQQLLARTIPQASDIYVLGVNDAYVFNNAQTSLLSTVGHELLPEQVLQNATFDGGVLNGDDMIWLAAASGVIDRSLILQGVLIYFKNAGAPVLLAFIDSASVGLPQELTGVDVTAIWDARGILKL